MRKDTSPYIYLLGIIWLVNIFSSVYFVTIFLAGAAFMVFLESIKNEYFYILIFTILTFCFIEVSQGINLFVFTFISMLMYYFVIPRIEHLFSMSFMGKFIYLLIFYMCFLFYSFLIDSFSFSTVILVIFNFLLDCFIVGLFLWD